MKFALMHIDQAIELLLKEKVRRGGHSIHKQNNTKETINVCSAYQILEDEMNRKIKERPDLELLHEERNNIQHKYSNPSSDDAAFHVENAMKFLVRFVLQELQLNIYDFIPKEQLGMAGFLYTEGEVIERRDEGRGAYFKVNLSEKAANDFIRKISA